MFMSVVHVFNVQTDIVNNEKFLRDKYIYTRQPSSYLSHWSGRHAILRRETVVVVVYFNAQYE